MQVSNHIIHFIGGISDFLIAIVALWAFFDLLKHSKNEKYHRYYVIHFLLLATSTIFGGLAGHIFLHQIEPSWKLPGWLISMVSVTYLERAIIAQSAQVLPKKWVKYLLGFNILELLFFAYLTITTLHFKYVEYHAAYGLLVVILGIGLLQWKKGLFRIHLFLGLFFSLLAALVFQFHFSISVWWNYLGLSHIMLAFSAYFFFRLSKE